MPLVYPVAGGGSISSGLGARRAPLAGASTNHRGIDIRGSQGTPILATNNQTIERVSYDRNGYGQYIYARDAQNNQHRYAHLNSQNVTVGQSVNAGQPIGTLGSTGNSTGPHLHYEVRDAAGNVLNPSKLLNGALSKAKSVASNALKSAALSNPITAPLAIGVSALGIGSSKSWLEQFQDWLKNSGFFQRLALFFVGGVFLIVAFYFFKSNTVSTVIQNVSKKAIK